MLFFQKNISGDLGKKETVKIVSGICIVMKILTAMVYNSPEYIFLSRERKL